MTRKQFFLLWIYVLHLEAAVNAIIVKAPQLRLQTGITPKSRVASGDSVTISAEVSHTEKSYSDAVDVELSLACSVHITFGTYSSTLTPQNVTKHRNHEILFKFSNISLSTHVTVTVPTVVDAYHMVTARDETIVSCMARLWYYGVMDACSRPASKWNARSTSNVAQFSLTAKAVCESELQLHESSFSASSFEKPSYESLGNSPHRANFAQDLAWTPTDKYDIHQYLQIELDHLTRITKVATKGNGDVASPSYVSKFVLYYSRDGYDWSMAYAALQSHEFEANNDSTSVKMNTLKISVKAKILRIVPKLWKTKIALKVQLFGCPVHQVPAGFQPLGMASGRIEDNKISSSGSPGTYKPYHARLNFNTGSGGWCTGSGAKKTLHIDLDVDYVIAEIAIQSKYQTKDKLIKQFKISYKKNGGTRTHIKASNNAKIFLGHQVEDTIIRHKFLEPILARNVFIEPTTLTSTGCLRLELYGYKSGDEYISGYCTIFDFEGDKSLMQWNKSGTAFDNQPTFLDNLYARTGRAAKHEGVRWIGSRENRAHAYETPGATQGNGPIGTLTSPGFIISASKLYFLLAGTADKTKARVELLIEGLVARTAFSKTGNDSLVPMSWDVEKLLGRQAQIRIVDSGSDAFVSFDGLKSNCHPSEELLPVFERSFLLNRFNNTLYICHVSHTSKREEAICRLTSDNGLTWQDLNHIAGLYGVNEVTGELYGVSMDRRDRLVSRSSTGKETWYKIETSEWDNVKDSLNKVVEIPNIPSTDLTQTDDSLPALIMSANSGDSFSASSLGIYHLPPSGGSWSMIATWRCKEYPDACVSNPCNNGGTCNVTSDGGYNCTCPQGFTGDICDHEIDECSESPCLNDAQCVDVEGINTFYCVCNSFYTGERCEQDIDDCATSLCSQGSVCIDGLGTFTCQCPPGYAGEFCQMKTDECASMPCQNDGQCVDHVNGYTCQCRRGYSGINCEHVHASAFEVIRTKSVVYESARYTVVHARIPQDGLSRHQTWCHDYAELCYSLDNKMPTGCGRSSNHITEIHQCQTIYGSVMSQNNTLGCPPNDKVSTVARLAGFSNAVSANSFAFSKCGSTECTNVLPISGCHGALHCINQTAAEVYTLCTDPEGNTTLEAKTHGFVVLEEQWVVVDNKSFLAIKSRLPYERSSIQENWCEDYAKLCESYGLRPTGSDVVQNHEYTSCRDNYGSLMMDGVFFGSSPKSKISSIAQQAGFASANVDNSFGMAKCTQCPSVLTSSNCEGLGCIKTSAHDDVYTVCIKVQSGFDVLERKTTAYNNTAYVVMKAKVIGNKLLNWTDEYTKTCSRYGGRNIVCNTSSIQASQPSLTTTTPNASTSIPITPIASTSIPITPNASTSIPITHIASTSIPITPNASTSIPITPIASTSIPITPNASTSIPITPIASTSIPITPAPHNCSDIDQVAELTDEEITCSQAEVLKKIAFNAGFSNATTSNIHIPDSRTPSSEVVYLLCEGSDSNFDVISTKAATVRGQEYLVVETKLPQNGLARYETWCEDYKQLCLSYGQRPLGCDKDSGGLAHTACRDYYDAMLSSYYSKSCPSNLGVICLAKQIGYLSAKVDNSFAFSVCNESTCSKTSANAIALYSQVKLNHVSTSNNQLYTMCVASNTSFTVESSKNVSYLGGVYKIVKARIPFKHISKQETWCHDYQSLCSSYGWRPIITSRDGDNSCEQNYKAIEPIRDEVSSNEKLEYLVKNAGYENAKVGNIFSFGKKCSDSCFASISEFSKANEPAINVSSKLVSQNNDVIFALCMNSDTNFRVLGSSRVDYHNRSYLVLKTKVAPHGISKHESWCTDYQRLCEENGMRPVTILSRESNPGSGGAHVGSCLSDYMSIVVSGNESLNLFTREEISIISNSAGYHEASRYNSFAFSECNPKSCSRFLNSKCTPGLDCLSSEPLELYTACVESNNNFMVEKKLHIQHKGVPYLIVRSSIPKNGISRHQNWCLDYKALCNSFGMKPVLCESQNSPSYCSSEFSNTSNSCELKNMTTLSKLIDERFLNDSSVFMPARCDTCNENPSATVLTVCTALQTNFKVLETKQADYHNERVTIVKAKVLSNGTSFHKNWGHDYNKMCLSLGKRPFSCHQAGNEQQYNNREQYNIYLSYFENCSDIQTFKSLVVQAGFSDSKNLLLFQSSLIPGNTLVSSAVPSDEVHMSGCPAGKDCSSFNTTGEVYTFCFGFSASNFEVEDARDVVYADRPYTVVKAQIPTHGQSHSENWCEDYRMLCEAIGKRPVGCGKDFEVLKQSRDCRVHYDAIMMKGMPCPGSEKVADIAKYAGFPASVNESQGLWNCEVCSKNFSETWNNMSLSVYLLCAESDSNLKVLETHVVQHRKSPVSVVMTTIPQHGQSFHENWCVDYSRLCQSYGLRPIGCGKSADNMKEHAQCRDRYDALMYSDDSVDCSEKFKLYEIAQSAGFSTATAQNTFIFKSCLAQHCTKFLPSAEHPFTKFEVGSTDRVLYTMCASSDSAYDVIATKPITIAKQDYLVIRARIPVGGQSKYVNWCKDYQRLCEGYVMRPLTCKQSSVDQRACMYDFEAIRKTNADLACPPKTGVASVAKQAGFDNVTDTNSFAMDRCDVSKSCVAKMPNRQCKDTTYYDSLFETNATQVNITHADYFVNATKTVGNQTIAFLQPHSCSILQNPQSGDPPYVIDGERLTDIFKGNICETDFDLNGSLVTPSQLTANQTFEHKIPRVVTSCWFLSTTSLSQMSGEANTVCIRANSESSFEVQSTRTTTSSGREYLIIQTKIVSPLSKSTNWCMEYANLCKAFQSSPLACPRRFEFNTDYVKCVSGYGAIMPSGVAYTCPSNGLVSDLARMAGYTEASPANTFSLGNCNDAKCTSKLPQTGCSHAVQCLNHEVLHDHVYTACVVSNSDSNFNVIEKQEKQLGGYDYTMIRARLPVNQAPLFETWCEDYERLCKSFNLRPIYCTDGLSINDYSVCKQKYSSVLSYEYDCSTRVDNMARSAGLSGANDKNSFAFRKCSMCSKTLQTTCDKALSCLTTRLQKREVHTACGDSKTLSGFQPLATKEVLHGHVRLRVIQAKVIRQSSDTLYDWGKDYRNLCGLYNELPTGCGLIPGGSNAGVSECESKYSSHVLKGNELGCNPNDVIAMLARNAGFVNASPNTSFGFSYCNVSAVSQLSSTCHPSLPCLTWTPENPVVYTVCAKKPIESNFKVLDTKSITFNHLDYLVIHAEIPKDGRSYKSNWCYDYKELCTGYNMFPTGCGGDNVEHLNYSSCSTQYGSYMPANDILGCGDTKLVSSIARKAGFKDAIPANSFVFYNCHQCSNELTKKCNGALNCINNIVWQGQVYTTCVRPLTAFNVRSTAITVFRNSSYLVVQAKLPSDGQSVSESWCRDYEKLCKSYNARPLFCHGDEKYLKSARRYTAKESLLSCDGKDISIIAKQAGFSDAKQGNTFILNNCHKCSKELDSSGCDDALSCINSNPAGYVHAVCSKDSANFEIVDTQKLSISGDVYTVVSAVHAIVRASTSWCDDYTELCHAIGQSPVALHSGVVTEQLLKCRDNYDAILQKSAVDAVHQMANQAGYSGAEYGNTFAFKDCTTESCQSSTYSYNCSSSLHCLNGVARKLYGLCIENTPSSNFYKLDSKTVYSNDTTYAVLKVRIPVHRLSKFDSWCRDYERLCHAHSLRPLTSLTNRKCTLEYFGVYSSTFNTLSLLSVVHLAGFSNANTSDVYSLQNCGSQECGRKLESTNQRRVFYAVCGSVDENLQTNLRVQNIRTVWYGASFLVAHVRIPGHRKSKTEDWCLEYQTFCKSYARQPYTSRNVSSKSTIDVCSWNYNATSYNTAISPGVIVERAGFTITNQACVSSLYDCTYCGKVLDEDKCPFEDCQAAVKTCNDFYIICT